MSNKTLSLKQLVDEELNPKCMLFAFAGVKQVERNFFQLQIVGLEISTKKFVGEFDRASDGGYGFEMEVNNEAAFRL
jgi:hypothetical protein